VFTFVTLIDVITLGTNLDSNKPIHEIDNSPPKYTIQTLQTGLV